MDAAWAAAILDPGQKALRTRRFWFLFLAFFCLAFADQGTLLHAVSVMVDHGLARETAAYYFGILGLAGSAGKSRHGLPLRRVYGRERTGTLGIVALAADRHLSA
jgi:hypothetical protein